MMDTRTEDRFSKDLRIVAVCEQDSDRAGSGERAKTGFQANSGELAVSAGALLTPPLGQAFRAPSVLAKGAGKMTGNMQPELTPARARVLEQRAAAARRRGQLTLVLLLLTATVAGVAFISSVSWLFTLIPFAILVTVLVLGRRTVVANTKSDQALATREHRRAQYAPRQQSAVEEHLAGRPTPVARPGAARRSAPVESLETSFITPAESKFFAKKNATGRPVVPREPVGMAQGTAKPAVQVPEATAVADAAPATQGTEQARVAGTRSVQKYPVMAAAPRWEPPSITTELRKLTAQRMAELTSSANLRDNHAQDPENQEQKETIPDSLGVNLNSILARRRAV